MFWFANQRNEYEKMATQFNDWVNQEMVVRYKGDAGIMRCNCNSILGMGCPACHKAPCEPLKIIEKIKSKDKTDDVNHPRHYTSHPSGIECIEITRHFNFAIGNSIKYLWRAGLKNDNAVKDLKKAIWYIQDEIKRIEKS
jgi:hypothetical protein